MNTRQRKNPVIVRLPMVVDDDLTRGFDAGGAGAARNTAAKSGAEGSRTLDLLNAIQALSQLSYSPVPRERP